MALSQDDEKKQNCLCLQKVKKFCEFYPLCLAFANTDGQPGIIFSQSVSLFRQQWELWSHVCPCYCESDVEFCEQKMGQNKTCGVNHSQREDTVRTQYNLTTMAQTA